MIWSNDYSVSFASVSTAKHNGQLGTWVNSQVMNFLLNCGATSCIDTISNFTGRIILLLLFIAFQMGGTLYLPTLTADIINNGVMLGNQDYVLRIGTIMLGVAMLTGHLPKNEHKRFKTVCGKAIANKIMYRARAGDPKQTRSDLFQANC